MARHSAFARAGAVCYVIWSLLHFQASIAVYRMAAIMAFSPEQGRVFQDAWNLFFFAVASLLTAILLNWRNDRIGFWINFCVVGVADGGFIVFVMLPGHVGIWPGILGPVFWVAGVLLTAIALYGKPETSNRIGQM